ncbi:hypothetical protein [Streptomyces sp. NPDC058382]|uniref:hypothetical protein n=1 Tax=unclassified Streptomyces TaxID=2593676 RepID=UPI0036439E34
MSTPAATPPQPDTDEQAPPDSPLTTKEGWRRYVEPRDHPAEAAARRRAGRADRPGTDRADDRRREYHADCHW